METELVGVAQIAIPAKDIERAAAFYRNNVPALRATRVDPLVVLRYQ